MMKVNNSVKTNPFQLVNRQCEYDEYKAIMIAGFLNEAKNPYFNWKNKFETYEDRFFDSAGDELTPEVFVGSDVRRSI